MEIDVNWEDSPLTPGQLVKAVSIALDVPEETVVQHDRNLVVAGLRTTGARGRNAPAVTPLDAARLLVATLASIRTKDSIEVVRACERLIFSPPRHKSVLGAPDVALTSLPKDHNFIDGVAAVIAAASSPIENLESWLERFANLNLSCTSLGAAIGGSRGLADYHKPCSEVPALEQKSPFSSRKSKAEWQQWEYCHHGIEQTRLVTGTAIMLLGAAFRDNGLRYANPRDAYLAGYGTKTKSPAKSKKKAA